ncbi:Helix-turn-helix domain-containing protein [Prauserella halophila]|nr:Helix-turn-helix domain-containing protein [Prauserella halophila]
MARKTIRARRLGQQLRKIRESAGFSQGQPCEALNVDQSKRTSISQGQISKIEAGNARLDADQLARIMFVLDMPDETVEKLEDLRASAETPGWWSKYNPYLPSSLELMVELGDDATTLSTYDAVFVQGLLQTEDYARAVVESARAWIRPTAVEDLVELRMRRQERLAEKGFGRLTAVLAESTLYHQVGGPNVLRAQLEKLCEVAEEGHQAVHVLPFESGPWPGIGGFVIFGFPDDEDAEVAQVDSDLGAAIYEDKESIKSVTYTHNAALAQALSARATLDRLQTVKKELE